MKVVPRISDLDLRPLITVGTGATLQAAATAMRSYGVSSLVVGEPGEPVSVVTEHDLTRAVAEGWDPGAPVAALASPDPLTVATDTTVVDAAVAMLREGVRHLVVTIDNRAVGMVSSRDLLAALVGTVRSESMLLLRHRAECAAPENWLG